MINLYLAQLRTGWKVLAQRIADLSLCDRFEGDPAQASAKGKGQNANRDSKQYELAARMVR